MTDLFTQYLPIVIFLGVALFIGALLLAVPFGIAVNNPDPEKVSAYECGFNAFDDARMKFDVRFYLVSILHHLDRTARQPERHPHEAAGARPVDQIVGRRDEEALVGKLV